MLRYIPFISKIIAFILILGIILKILHINMADQFLIIGMSSLVLIIPIYLIAKMKEASTKIGKLAFFLLIPGLCILVLGILYKIMHWPGANEMCSFGFILIVFSTLLFAFYKFHKL